MSQVNTEIGLASTAQTSLNDSLVRQAAASISGTGVLSGQISLSNLYGASATQVLPGFSGAISSSGITGYDNSFSQQVGSFSPVPVIQMVGGLTLAALYFRGNSPFTGLVQLKVFGQTTYTGNILLYQSPTENDPWPNTPPSFTLLYNSYSGGISDWVASTGSDSVNYFENNRTFRIQKV
jgi:hypothetical protein